MEYEILDAPITPVQTDPDEDPCIEIKRPGVELERAIQGGLALDDEQMGREAALGAFGPKAFLMDPEAAAQVAARRLDARKAMQNLAPEPWRLSAEAEEMLRWMATPDHVYVFSEGQCHRAVMGGEPDQNPTPTHPLDELRTCFDFVECQMVGAVLVVEIGRAGKKYLDQVDGALPGPPTKPATWCDPCAAFHFGGAALHG